MSQRKTFITFGGGGQNYIDAGHRLVRQADALGLFDETILYTDEILKADSEFWNQHKTFVESNPRGYGYWLWKPYIIQKTMQTLQDGDILLYLDGGCEIDIRKKANMEIMFKMVQQDLIIGTYAHPEKCWTKKDLLLLLDMDVTEHLETNQHQAGALLFYICPETRDLVKAWYNIGCNYHMIDDSPSFHPEHPEFREHRWDQSIFSLLTKHSRIYSKYILTYAIEYIRNRSGTSVI
jgi:hypothetical protein